jgi:hypothetical protein
MSFWTDLAFDGRLCGVHPSCCAITDLRTDSTHIHIHTTAPEQRRLELGAGLGCAGYYHLRAANVLTDGGDPMPRFMRANVAANRHTIWYQYG